jgi:hypothetical protein
LSAGLVNFVSGYAIGRTGEVVIDLSLSRIALATWASNLVAVIGKTLSLTEAHDRLVAARDALGHEPGATKAVDTALVTARRALVLLQLALIQADQEDT